MANGFPSDCEARYLAAWQSLFILSLSLLSPLICGVNFYVCGRFSTPLFKIIFRVGLPAYLRNHNPFPREHIFVGFNEFPFLVCWCIVIHHHQPQGPTLLQNSWDFTCLQCDVCTECHRHGTSCFKVPSEKTR